MRFSMLVFHPIVRISEVILITVLQCYRQTNQTRLFNLHFPHQVQAKLKIKTLQLGGQHTYHSLDEHIFHIFLNKSLNYFYQNGA